MVKNSHVLRPASWAAMLVILILVLACTSDKESNQSQSTEEISEAISVVDALGRTISFRSVPERIAAISPTATEILYAAGGTSILRDRSSNFPLEVESLPDVGSAYDPSIETLVSAKPDLVLIESITQARLASVLEQANLKVMAVKSETIDDIKNYIIKVGKIIGKENVASGKVSEIENRLAEAGKADGRSVLILISDQDRNLYAARPESYTGLIATTLGLINKAEGLPDSGPYPGFSLISPEAILVANPDVLITITPAPEPAPRLSKTITQIPPFASLRAVQNMSIFEADAALFLQAPGPRIVEAVESLKRGLEFNDSK